MYMQNESWARSTAPRIVSQVIITELIGRMKINNFSDKIIAGIRLGEVSLTKNHIHVKIICEFYSKTGFDVAVAREFGTKRHKIMPLNRAPNFATVLSWIQSGRRMFSKGHWVSGIKALHLIRNTIKELTPRAQEQLDEEFQRWKKEIIDGS